MSYQKLCDLFLATVTRLWSRQWFLCHAHWCVINDFKETFVPKVKKTTTDRNLLILCKACWAWMMWQGIIYGWLHLNWICSPFTSFLPFYVPPCFQGLDLIQPTSSFWQKDPSFVFFLKRPSFMVSILGLVLAPVAWLCLSSIFTVLARAQKWQLWSPRSQFTTP